MPPTNRPAARHISVFEPVPWAVEADVNAGRNVPGARAPVVALHRVVGLRMRAANLMLLLSLPSEMCGVLDGLANGLGM